jgi:hypothetical protein
MRTPSQDQMVSALYHALREVTNATIARVSGLEAIAVQPAIVSGASKIGRLANIQDLAATK